MLSSLLGFIVGLTLGLTGAGGGILAVPALVLGVGLSMTTAAPIALIAVGLAALTGAIDGLRRRMVRYKAALLMSIVGGVISPLGVWLAQRLPELWLMVLFSLVMFIVAGRMFNQARHTQKSGLSPHDSRAKACMVSDNSGKFVWTMPCFLTIGSIGAVSGLLTGLLGVGGGFIIVPMLKRFTNLKMHSIVSTSLMVIALISAVTVINALTSHVALPPVTWPFVSFVVGGMIAGRIVAPKIPATFIQMGFASLCALSACIVLLNAFNIL